MQYDLDMPLCLLSSKFHFWKFFTCSPTFATDVSTASFWITKSIEFFNLQFQPLMFWLLLEDPPLFLLEITAEIWRQVFAVGFRCVACSLSWCHERLFHSRHWKESYFHTRTSPAPCTFRSFLIIPYWFHVKLPVDGYPVGFEFSRAICAHGCASRHTQTISMKLVYWLCLGAHRIFARVARCGQFWLCPETFVVFAHFRHVRPH